MWTEDAALFMLRSDGECPEAEDRLRQLLVQMERDGIPPRQIASAQARILLGFCAEQGRHDEHTAWALFFLGAVASLMEWQRRKHYRSWVQLFLKQAHQLYETARFQIKADRVQPPPLPPFAIDIATPEGTA
jgi:hypothetical protein